MKRYGKWTALFVAILATCSASHGAQIADPLITTTTNTIAINNLDQQIAQLGDEPGVEELLLVT